MQRKTELGHYLDVASGVKVRCWRGVSGTVKSSLDKNHYLIEGLE